MNTFSANEVIAQVEGLNTVKTLNRWRKIVDEHFGIKYFRHDSNDVNPAVISYSQDEVKRLQSVAQILSEQPSNCKNLHQAIVTAFSSNEPFVKKKTEIDELKDKVNSWLNDLANEDKRLLAVIQEINRKLVIIENQLSVEKVHKSKIFRRK